MTVVPGYRNTAAQLHSLTTSDSKVIGVVEGPGSIDIVTPQDMLTSTAGENVPLATHLLDGHRHRSTSLRDSGAQKLMSRRGPKKKVGQKKVIRQR